MMADDRADEGRHASDAQGTEGLSGPGEEAAAGHSSAEPNIDDVIALLCAPGKTLPEKAVIDARRLRPQIIPRLIELIQEETETARRGQKLHDDGAFFSVYLLTEFRAKEALPAILDAAKLPASERSFFGDAIGDDLNRILAVLAVDEPDVVEKLIDDRALDMYLRWEVANTYKLWVRDGAMTREAAVQRLREHLAKAVQHKDADIAAPLVCNLGDLAAVEAEHEIKEAYRLKLVDDTIIDEPFLEEQLRGGEATWRATLMECPPSGIPDTIEFLSRDFADRELPEPDESFERPAHVRTPPATPAEAEPRPEPVGTIRHADAHVGRNEPCPCGSGKKYKKCCGVKHST
jgi:hypothetical protein